MRSLAGDRTNRTRSLFVGVCVCLVFFAIWIGNLGYPELTEEEATVDMLASQPTSQLLQRLNVDEPHPPLFYLVQHGWNLVGGSRNELLVRFPSVVLGILLLSLTYQLGRSTGLGWRAALVAVVWLGLNPQITYHVREARMYPLMATTAALAAVIAVRFERLPRRGAVWIAAAATAGALLSHYFNIFFVGAIAAWGLLTFRGQARRRWFLAQAVAWSLFAIWTLFFGHAFLNPTSLSEGKTWSIILPPWELLANLVRSGVFGYRDLPVPWLSWIGGGLLIGIWFIGSVCSRGRARSFLLGAVAAPLVVYALLCWFKPLYHPKYVLPWLALAAPALGWLLTRRPRLGTGWLIATLALMASPTLRTIQLPYYYPGPATTLARTDWLRPERRQVADYLDRYADATDVFGYGVPSTVDCYYADFYIHRSLGCHLLVQNPHQSVADAERNLTELLSQHTLLWYRDISNTDWDPGHAAQEALNRRAIALGTENTNGLPLHLYAGSSTILSQQQQLDIRFGEVAQLNGIWLAQRGTLHLVLVWRSLADHPLVAAKVFVHLVSSSDEVLAQMDNVPVAWTRPLETWKKGEQLLDVYELALPADAARLSGATLQVGMYDPDTGARFPASDRSDQPLPGDKVTLPFNVRR